MVIGPAIYEPGWKRSTHIGERMGKRMCNVEQVGIVVSGTVVIVTKDGQRKRLDLAICFMLGNNATLAMVSGL